MSKKKDLSTGMSERTSDIILVAICAVVLVIVAYPLYYVLVASFSDPYEVYAGKTFLLPSGFTLDGYKAVFAEKNIVSGFLNSVKYTGLVGSMWSLFLPGGVAVGNMWHKTDFETAVKEREGLWIRDGGPTDQEWEEYKEYLSKKCGMDDPNGFSFYKGECHLFYQYHPYSNEWGSMHWGPGVPRRQWGRLPDRGLRARRKRLLAPVCPIH